MGRSTNLETGLKEEIMTKMKCQNCHKHGATLNWVGEGGALGFTHGMYQRWCACCILKAQIKHARKAVGNLSRLERKLETTKCK